MSRRPRGLWRASAACLGLLTVNAAAQSLPEAFDPVGASVAEPPVLGWLLALPQRKVATQVAFGVSSIDLGRGARATYLPLGWVHRDEGEKPGSAWQLQVQTDGYKRVSSPAQDRSGLADITVTSVWERALDARVKGKVVLGAIVPTHGEVGGKRAAALFGGGVVGALPGTAGQLGSSLTMLSGVPAAAPGASRNAFRADLQWAKPWAPHGRTALSASAIHQEAAPSLREVALAAVYLPQQGVEWRARVWQQHIESVPRRRGLGLAIAWTL